MEKGPEYLMEEPKVGDFLEILQEIIDAGVEWHDKDQEKIWGILKDFGRLMLKKDISDDLQFVQFELLAIKDHPISGDAVDVFDRLQALHNLIFREHHPHH